MALYRTKQTVTVQAIRIGDGGYQGIVDWLQANYSGAWSIIGSNDPAAVQLEFTSVTGKQRGAIGEVLVADGALPASVLSKTTVEAFLAKYEPVP